MPVPGYEQDFVIDHIEALQRALAGELTGKVVLLDAVGHIEAIGLGELLGRQDVDVTVRHRPVRARSPSTPRPSRPPSPAPCGPAWPGARTPSLGAIGDHEVTLVDVLSHAIEQITDVDSVVIRTHGRPENALVAELEGKVPEVIAVGDAVAVRPADRAIWDGHQAGRAL